jgi:hypothetical protein
MHLVPSAVDLPANLSFLLTHFSFAWHLESAARGIIDTGDIFFYLIPTAGFLWFDARNLARGRSFA